MSLDPGRPREVNADDVEGIRPVEVRVGLAIWDPGPRIELTVSEARLVVSWGQPHQLGTCAYWVDQTRRLEGPNDHAIGRTLREEVAACLLGGHGVTAEMGLHAFRRLLDEGALAEGLTPSAVELEELLVRPFVFAGGVSRQYRFPKQRAQRLATALALIVDEGAPGDPLMLRQWLLRVPGIGPKTASWIVRNRTNSPDVAIIDVHVWRAGIAAGFFDKAWRLPREYARFERAFLAVAALGAVPASDMDACIWGQLHSLGRASRLLLGNVPRGSPQRRAASPSTVRATR